ncbi:MAG: tetraacyldisaccharide 4'-kinase, partial [Pseudohongiellaceae bacterium]
QQQPFTAMTGKVHAVAGIGNPQRFFDSLSGAGFDIITHVFDDHHRYQRSDIDFADELPVIMTEKDAVKCQSFADQRHWYLKVQAQVEAKFLDAFLERLKTVKVSN